MRPRSWPSANSRHFWTCSNDDAIVVATVMHFVYILRCADGSLYIGEADDIEHRIARHQAGRASEHTARRLPVELVYKEEFPNYLTARRRERQLKGWTRAKKEALIAGNLAMLKEL